MTPSKETHDVSRERLIDAEGKLRKLLERDGVLGNFPDVKIVALGKYRGDVILGIGLWKNATTFYRETNGQMNMIFNTSTLTNGSDFQDIALLTGYRSGWKQEARGNLHRIKDSTNAPIDGFSMEYYIAWENIKFFEDRAYIEIISQKRIHTKNGLKDQIEFFMDSKSLRVIDLMRMLEIGNITIELYKKYLPKLIQDLSFQISDDRFDTIGRGVSKTELTLYRDKKIITEARMWYIWNSLSPTTKFIPTRQSSTKIS